MMRAAGQELAEQQREQPRAQIFRDGQVATPIQREPDRALGQQDGAGRTAAQPFGKMEQRQIIDLEAVLDLGRIDGSHCRPFS